MRKFFTAIYARIEAAFSRLLPWYPGRHSAIAVLLAALVTVLLGTTAGAVVGIGFYLAHELLDRFVRGKNNGRFDWPGLLWPLYFVGVPWLAALLHSFIDKG